jgi:hypothetical protein
LANIWFFIKIAPPGRRRVFCFACHCRVDEALACPAPPGTVRADFPACAARLPKHASCGGQEASAGRLHTALQNISETLRFNLVSLRATIAHPLHGDDALFLHGQCSVGRFAHPTFDTFGATCLIQSYFPFNLAELALVQTDLQSSQVLPSDLTMSCSGRPPCLHDYGTLPG